MTEEREEFLARWSRRKREAKAASATVSPTPVSSAPVSPAPVLPAPASLPPMMRETPDAPAQTLEPATPKSELPPPDLPVLDMIGAATDLTPWLQKAVPAAVRQAALARAWTADPAINGFVGLAENAWDWNTPGGAPGFGPLDALDDVQSLVARVFSGPQPIRAADVDESYDAGPGAAAQTAPAPGDEADSAPPMHVEAELTPADAVATSGQPPVEEARTLRAEAAPATRRHGAALPA
ncbi:MAG: DUF3306 domain-containing protein [Hyphomicrobiales bacterium]|nr:DUF3306 domain-containing protein [Hyphomicrobiales bacterium]